MLLVRDNNCLSSFSIVVIMYTMAVLFYVMGPFRVFSISRQISVLSPPHSNSYSGFLWVIACFVVYIFPFELVSSFWSAIFPSSLRGFSPGISAPWGFVLLGCFISGLFDNFCPISSHVILYLCISNADITWSLGLGPLSPLLPYSQCGVSWIGYPSYILLLVVG